MIERSLLEKLKPIAAGAAIAGHGWWNDYSDRAIHGVVALTIVALALVRPRIALVTAAVWLVPVALAWLISPPRPTPFVVGMTRAQLIERYGPPLRSDSTARLYSRDDWGYSLPPPIRTAHGEQVMVYKLRSSEGVAYAFLRNDRVVATFVGGS